MAIIKTLTRLTILNSAARRDWQNQNGRQYV
jgi:hypothetical protein